MSKEWQVAAQALAKIEIKANPFNEPVSIKGIVNDLSCIGVGTDAAVFRYNYAPNFAFKVYADDRLAKIEIEKKVYQQLGESPFFPQLYDVGVRYLVLNFEQGTTLYDCLLQGIHIPQQVVQDVEDARRYISKRGLNPRDIHLKNILLQNGRAKIIDVSEYIKPGNDFRWEHLKRGYEEYYHLIDGKPLPFWLLETIRKWYYQTASQPFAFEELMKKAPKFLLFGS